ncbi:MAG: L,D-transpeptidase [Coxiellaceae bacterium]|nr:L,D-transpeptidase [Coxiellaceae bacterium]
MKQLSIVVATSAALFFGSLGVSESALAAPQYYGKNLCGYPGFTCVKIKRGDTWERLFPNAKQRELVMRFNRTNIPLNYRSWIVVPDNLSSLNPMELSPFPLTRDTHGKKLIYVSLNKQAFGAYDANGKLVHWGPISGGRGYCADIGIPCNTATGNFKIYRKQGGECISSKFPVETKGGAPMPYCMHFNGGFAVHGSTLPGYNASHGCVRLFPEDAKWLNQDFANIGTPVIVSKS